MVRHLVTIVIALTGVTSTALLPAQEDPGVERVKLRVTSSSAGPPARVVVDRGKRDRVAVGDRVIVRPRDGSTIRGVVVQIEDRSAVVELHDAVTLPEPGTRGEVLVPRSRPVPRAPALPAPETTPETKPPAAGKKEEAPEHAPWTYREEDWKPGMPLLAGVKPVRPEDRMRSASGRVYLLGHLTENPDGDFTNSVLRGGTDLVVENPFGRGDAIRINGEVNYLTPWKRDDERWKLLIRRLSYYWGGTRYASHRWEFGRFLQHGMPEFGVLDGGEWSGRKGNHRFGASLGFLPGPVDDFESFADLQVAGYYEWRSGLREELVLGAGFQKTWHHGEADRDLLLAKLAWVPNAHWDVRGVAWFDFYFGDEVKSGVEVTLANVSVGHHWDNGSGIDLAYRHQEYPDLLRDEFIQPPLGTLKGQRYDRLTLNGWWWLDRIRLHGLGAGWLDENGSGGTIEGGVDVPDLLMKGTRADVTAFGAWAQFETVVGARASYGKLVGTIRWDLLYEISDRRQNDLPDDRNDVLQQRVRASAGFHAAEGWDFSTYVEGVFWDEEISWTVGFMFQRSF